MRDHSLFSREELLKLWCATGRSALLFECELERTLRDGTMEEVQVDGEQRYIVTEKGRQHLWRCY